jgi:hypothetical protein
MGSLDSALTRQALAKGEIVSHGTDEPVAIRLRYIGSGTVTSVTVTTATNIVAVTSDGGTDTYAFGTYDTYEKLVAAINKDGIFEAKALDVLLSTDPASDMVDGAITSGTDANGVVVWDANVDTSAALQIAACLTPHRDWDSPSRRVHLQEVRYSVNMGTAAADSVQVWRRRGSTETQVFGRLSVDTTETAITFASGEGKLTGNQDDEFIVLVKDAATLADAAGNFVSAIGLIE